MSIMSVTYDHADTVALTKLLSPVQFDDGRRHSFLSTKNLLHFALRGVCLPT
jgi:hypothetical protein